jgi:hypothetical protein
MERERDTERFKHREIELQRKQLNGFLNQGKGDVIG